MNSFYTLICTESDTASKTMLESLTTYHGFNKYGRNLYSSDYLNACLHITKDNLLFLDNLDTYFPDTYCYIFLSQHRSISNIPALTCHSTGNFDQNLCGGQKKELGICYPWLQKQYLIELNKSNLNNSYYDIVIEATHHGPTSLKKPVLFIEIGSTQKEWSDKTISRMVTGSLLKTISKNPRKCEKVGIAFGGNHYPVKFSKFLLETEFGLGTIVPKYNLQHLERDTIFQMIEKSTEKVEYAILDSRGLGKEKQRTISLIQESGLKIIYI